jgi:outer membrane protein assembly factor BamB
MNSRKFLFLIAASFGSAMMIWAADWPQFRGPGALGVAGDKGLPVQWSATSGVVWKTELPGPGTSSPIVVGSKIFLTCYSGYGVDANEPGEVKNLKRHLLCLDRAGGKVLWDREAAAVQPEPPYHEFLALHGYASSTPVSDGTAVFVFHGKSGVFAFDHSGKELWHTSVGKETHEWGSAASPVLYKDTVIVNASVESSTLFALDKKTGKEVWQSKGITESWSTPVLVPLPSGQTELVVSASKKVLGLDPDTGKQLWSADSFNWYVCPTLVAHGGVVYGLQNDACVAVRAGGRGDVTDSHTLWKKQFGSVVPSPVYQDGLLYWASGGTVRCLKAEDGSEVYRERLKPDAKQIYASPLLADGKLYYVSRTEGTYVLEAGPKFKLLAHNTLGSDTSVCNGSPAVSNSQLLLRSDRFLYCIGKGP